MLTWGRVWSVGPLSSTARAGLPLGSNRAPQYHIKQTCDRQYAIESTSYLLSSTWTPKLCKITAQSHQSQKGHCFTYFEGSRYYGKKQCRFYPVGEARSHGPSPATSHAAPWRSSWLAWRGRRTNSGLRVYAIWRLSLPCKGPIWDSIPGLYYWSFRSPHLYRMHVL